MKLLLTSCLDFYSKNERGERIAHNFGNQNQILDNIKKHTLKFEHMVFVASNEFNFDATDLYADVTFQSFELTIPFKKYTILDGRTAKNAKQIIANADLIFLCGGHVPTQNEFFKHINLKEIIKNSKALIIGGSAGSMNCADIVYAQPELEGESIDPNYKKYLEGLGLTPVSILPHFEQRLDDEFDNKNILNEISLPDSKIRPFIAYSDGDYIFDDGQKQIMYGKAYLFKDGKYFQITQENAQTDITDLVSATFKTFNKF